MEQEKNRRDKRRLRAAVVALTACVLGILAAAFTYGGLGGQKGTEGTGIWMEGSGGRAEAEENLTVVGFSQVGSESVWRTANTESVHSVFTKENGYFLLFDNARQKQENQIKALRSFISQRVDYIILSPLTEDGWETVLQEAKEADIPVILIDRKVNVKDNSLYATWIGSDFYWEGRAAGEALEQALRKKGISEEETVRIVVLKGTEGSSATIGRTKGFQEVVDAHENWIILETADGEFTTAKGQEEMERLLDRYSDIDVVIAQNDDMAFGALAAIKRSGRTVGEDGNMLMISFDATKSALELVSQGVIAADIECNPDQGQYADEAIRKLERGEPVAKLYFVEEQIYKKENAAAALEERTY